ncbi:hypothetical protein LXA43DRAFT_1066345 [Ganoderma leucocontextum]|nr:hypothetical protein LXA43DRAFT_1066345 [Ganoderma leucocontextum]
MALACEVQSRSPDNVREDSQYAVAFEGVADVPIGINMKCCSLCFRLGQRLNSKESGVDITFQLPDTHEVIFAWDPPTFGIPQPVLEDLRNDLREKLVHVAVDQGNQLVSRTRQSSPTSGSQHGESPGGHPNNILVDHADIILPFKF